MPDERVDLVYPCIRSFRHAIDPATAPSKDSTISKFCELLKQLENIYYIIR